MQYIDLTLDTPAENLALDEALLIEADRAGQPVVDYLFLLMPAGAGPLRIRRPGSTGPLQSSQCAG